MIQNLIGIVIKTATAKTVKVQVAKQFEHPKVHKNTKNTWFMMKIADVHWAMWLEFKPVDA
ncbi:8242_t:CDS:2 [Diversispora eburnea]|uniref:8242_t:CDS:1 n=1 Tax=Diversispora eburnea TaxID=1213867 RepID=A0A9N8Z8S8_9GLOM|nr:8242_t:CDS:2 [Diversispora eburnea]